MGDWVKSIGDTLKVLNQTKVWVLVLVLIGFLAYTYQDPIGKWMLKDDSMRPLEVTINRDVLIYSVMEDMLREFEAARVYIYTFHNGQNFLSEDDILKHKQRSSMDYEVVANGVIEIGLQMQNVPVSLFAQAIDAILSGEVLGVKKDDAKDAASRGIMKQTGVSHASILPYKDRDGRVIMMIGIDWVMQKEITFNESRFRNWVTKVGDLFMGYSETAKIWNLKEGNERGDHAHLGASVEVDAVSGATAKEEEAEPFHFILGSRSLPRSKSFLTEN